MKGLWCREAKACIAVILGLYRAIKGVYRLHRNYRGYIGVVEKKMEATI